MWHRKPWEVSNLFTNQGQEQDPGQTKPSETDLSGLINFIARCLVPRASISNTQCIGKVREARNIIMHSASMMISTAEFQSYVAGMIDLLEDPLFMNSLKERRNAVKAIKEIRRNLYLKELYKDCQQDVPVLPGCFMAPVLEIFTPVMISREIEATATTSGHQEKGHNGGHEIESYKNIFHDQNGDLKTRIFLQGKAGSGKLLVPGLGLVRG